MSAGFTPLRSDRSEQIIEKTIKKTIYRKGTFSVLFWCFQQRYKTKADGNAELNIIGNIYGKNKEQWKRLMQ